MEVKRFEIYRTNLDPTLGREIKKIRPCVVISPDEMNSLSGTVIIAPLTGSIRPYPSRVDSEFREKIGQVALDRLRSLDQRRLLKKLGVLDRKTQLKVLYKLTEMFAP